MSFPPPSTVTPTPVALRLGLVSLVVAMGVGYVIAFPRLFDLFGVTSAIATVAPVVLVAWSFGPRWGLVAGLATVPLNALAFGQLGITYADEPLRSGALPGTIGWTLVGYLVGSARAFGRRHSVLSKSLAAALAERTRAERALRVERDRYEMLLDAQSAVGDAVLLGRRERVEWANDALLKLTNRTIDELRALPSVYELIAPAEQATLRAVFSAPDQPRQIAHVVRTDGTMFPAEIALRTIRLEDNDRGFVVVARDVTDRVEAERLLRRHADEDSLTGLANRAQLERRLDEMLATDGATVAVLLLDLDGFKLVNDRYGHAAGDAVLQIVARRLIGQVRDGDVVARLGGDEFVIVAPGATRARAEAIASDVRRAISRPLRIGDIGCAVGASVGVAVSPADATTTAALLSAADAAMYESKGTRL